MNVKPDINKRLLSKRIMFRHVADMYKRQYCHNGKWQESAFYDGSFAKDTYNALVALDPETATEADYDKVVNSTWTAIRCDHCGNGVLYAIEMGEEPDHDSSTATLCESCIREALLAIAELKRTER